MLDHLVYATGNLTTTVDELAHGLGVRPSPGGRHPELGTENCLADLGNGAYLEIIGPDGGLPPPGGRPFGIDALPAAKLVAWAARTRDMSGLIKRLTLVGWNPGPVISMARRDRAGSLLRWDLTVRDDSRDGGVLPFFIDWGITSHPTRTAAGGLRLASFRAAHPDPATMAALLTASGEALTVDYGPEPALTAVICGPGGTMVLT